MRELLKIFVREIVDYIVKSTLPEVMSSLIKEVTREVALEKIKEKFTPEEIVNEIKDGGKAIEDIIGKIF